MSNFFRILVVVFAVTAVQSDDDEQQFTLAEVVELMAPFGTDCEHKPEREHIEELILSKIDAQYGTKCFRLCLMEQFDTFQKGSTQMNVKQVVSLLGMVFPGKSDQLTQLADKCNAENSAVLDKCEAAHAHSMCMLRDMKAQGYEIPEVVQDK